MVPKRHTGLGPVRRLLFAASLALIALAPAWVTPEVAAAADRLPDLRAARPSQFRIVNVNGRRLLRFTRVLINTGAWPIEVLARRASTTSPWRIPPGPAPRGPAPRRPDVQSARWRSISTTRRRPRSGARSSTRCCRT